MLAAPDAAAAQTYPLIGVTGDGAVTPESLFFLDRTNASAIFVMALGNGADGETIGFNPDDDLLYHASGFAADDKFWESVGRPGQDDRLVESVHRRECRRSRERRDGV